MRKFRLLGVGIVLILAVLTATNTQAQISYGGMPPSFKAELTKSFELKELPAADVEALRVEDEDRDAMGKLYRYGVDVAANVSIDNAGTWTTLKNGDRIWRLTLKSENALALGVYYDDFWLPEGSELYLYNESKTQILGAFTHLNNPSSGIFANELVQGDQVTLEYYEPKGTVSNAIISISNVSYAYRSVHSLFGSKTWEYNSSESCQVDVNCPEGDDWRDQQRGVARISVVHDGQHGWCSGSLVNNTAEDCMPYFLTADHCADGANFEEVQQWVFYFNYERENCQETNEIEPVPVTMTGAVMKSRGGMNGSDFYLVLLSTYVPQSYNAYFNGWKTTNASSTNGQGIHHPAGDIKKISRYTQTAQTYQSYYWAVKWTPTSSGAGVTEGGSSGSPLFNSAKQIMGTLSFGLSACSVGSAGQGTGPNEYDFYGKFSSSWTSNGSNDEDRLKPWLSVDGTTPTFLNGRNNDCAEYPLMADFYVLDSIIPVGTTVKFYNTTLRSPEYNTSYNWTFQGVTGSSSTFINSPTRTYNTDGAFPVTLTATNNGVTSSVTRYIYVGNASVIENDENGTRIYPNPAKDKLNVEFSNLANQEVVVEIYDMIGNLISSEQVNYFAGDKITMNIPNVPTGFYAVKVNTANQTITKKISIVK